jgi:hypothetical protein
MAATQLKLRAPRLSLKMLEKRVELTRNHPLQLKASCLDGALSDPYGIVDGLKGRLKRREPVTIRDIERELRKLAASDKLDIQMEFVPEGIDDMERQVLDRYPDTRLFVGSDGAHSTFRKQLFPAENFERMELGYAAHVKYKVDGEARRLDKVKDVYPLLKVNDHSLATERLGKPEGGKTPVTIQIVIDKAEHEALKSATFKNPIRLFSGDPRQVPEKLVSDIQRFVGLRVLNGGHGRVDPATLTLSVTETPQHRNETVIARHGTQYLALLGDSALGLSFYKGMKSGLTCATAFAGFVDASWAKLQALEPGQEVTDSFLAEAAKQVSGSARSLPIADHPYACVVVNKAVNSRVRVFEGDEADKPAQAKSYGSVLGESNAKALQRAHRVAKTYPLHEYDDFMKAHASRKLEQGIRNNSKLGFKAAFVDVSSKVPWQVLKYSESQVGSIEQAGQRALSPVSADEVRAGQPVDSNRMKRLFRKSDPPSLPLDGKR